MITSEIIQIVLMADISRLGKDMAEAARIVDASTSKMAKSLDKAMDAAKAFGKAIGKIDFDELTQGAIDAADAADKMAKSAADGNEGLKAIGASAAASATALKGHKDALSEITAEFDKMDAGAKKSAGSAKASGFSLAETGERAKGAWKDFGMTEHVVDFAGWIKGGIDAAEAAGKLAEKAGLAVEDVAGLELAFKMGGEGSDGLAASMESLTKAAAGGNASFAKLKVDTESSSIALGGNKALLYAVADGFKNMKDGAAESALAVELFGSKGKELLPMLNGGAEGLRKMDETARSLGLTVSTETSQAAGAFNDNLELLKMGGQGVAQSVAAELLPTLSSMSGAFLTAMTSGDTLKRVVGALSAVLKALFAVAVGIIEVFNTVGKIIGAVAALIMTSLTGAMSVITKVAKGDFAGAWDEAKSSMKSMADTGTAALDDITAGWEASGKTIQDVMSGEGNAAFEAQAKMLKGEKDLSAARAKREAQAKAAQQAAAARNQAQDSFIAGLKKEVDTLGMTATALKQYEAAGLNISGKKLDIVNELLAKREEFEAKKKIADDEKLLRDAASADSAAAVKATMAETEALKLKFESYGKSPEEIATMKITGLEKSKEGTSVLRAAEIQAEIAALKELAIAKAAVDGQGKSASQAEAKALLDMLTEVDAATKTAAAGMTAAFGKVGAAIGGVATALTGYSVAQAKITSDLETFKLDPKNSKEDIGKAEVAAAQASTQARVKGYGDMAGAAKGFFKENSKGYKLMEGTEKAFRAYETAMAIQTMLTKSGLVTAFTSLFVGSKAAESAAEAGSTALTVGAAGTQASAWGITAVVKAIASMPFPMNLAAGAATLAAVVALGANIMGGSGGGAPAATTFEDKQKTQGTGTVLGDDTAKSESIAKSLELMEGYASLELDYQNAMLTALRNIEAALGGAAKNIMQTTGITGGSAFGTVNSSSANFFGSDKSTTIADSGVKMSGTFGALRAGKGRGVQYEDVIKTSDGGWFHGDSTSQYTNTKNLSAEAMKPFALIFDNMGNLLTDAGVKLGKDGGTLTRALNGINVGFEVSLRNLKGQDLADALAAGVSVAFDKVTTTLFPTIVQFQKMGEGLGETLVRVANDVSAVNSVFTAMGKSSASMSIEAKEVLVQAAGGLDQFASSAASFMKNFYTDAEQNAATKARLKPVLDQVGLSSDGPQAQKMFRDFVVGLDTSSAAGAKTYAMLMNVQQAFKDVTDAAAGERTDLLNEIDELTMSSAQLLNKQRMALDASNRGLFDQVQAMHAAKEAQEATKSSLGDVISKMKSFGDSARALRDGLLTGGLTTLNPEQQYAETRRQYQRTLAAAKSGDSAAQSGFSSSATAFLTASQKINSSDSLYSADFASVLQASDDIAQWTAGQVDVAQASLDALNAQVNGIANLNATMQGVGRGVDALLPDYRNMGTPDMAPLVAEIKGLREEVKTLRAEQHQQTGDMIASNAQVTERAASSVLGGAENTAWANRNRKVNLL